MTRWKLWRFVRARGHKGWVLNEPGLLSLNLALLEVGGCTRETLAEGRKAPKNIYVRGREASLRGMLTDLEKV